MSLVSIGIPVYNGQNYIMDSINSVLCQTFDDFELIISDNASTDDTKKICMEYAGRDRRIRYHRNDENLGYAKNFNKVFELSGGTYFKWISHDDVIHPTFLEKCVRVMDEFPDIIGVFPGMAYIDEFGKVIQYCSKDYSILGDDHAGRLHELMNHEIDGTEIFWSIYSLLRRDVLGKTSLHGTYVAADRVLLLELVLQGKIKHIDDVLLFIRKHPGSSMKICRLPKERYKWVNSERTPFLVFPSWNVTYQQYKAISRYDISMIQKIKGYYEVSRKIVKKDLRTLGGEIKVVGKEFIGMKDFR